MMMKRAKPVRRRVQFDVVHTAYHDPPSPLSPEECDAMWYSEEELRANVQDDIREIIRAYVKRVREGEQPDDKNFCSSSACGRGLDLLDPEVTNLKARTNLYRSLVIRQYAALRAAAMAENHAKEMLQSFASEQSRWARTRALALAAEDASQARKVYHHNIHSNDTVDKPALLPMVKVRSLRGSTRATRRKSNGIGASSA